MFCGHCGARYEDAPPSSRVCSECSLGLILQADAAAAPAPGDAFVVLDTSLRIGAISAAAEELLATIEPESVGRRLDELLVPAEGEPDGRALADIVVRAATGDLETHIVFLRPTGTFGVRVRATIAACGPTSAALLTLD